MYRRIIAGFAVLLALGLSAAQATSPVPRPSPDLTIMQPSGRPLQLSSFKGQVVLLEFLLTKCQRCVNAAQTINKLGGELGPRGFRPIGVAFDNGLGGPAASSFAQLLKINYPVGTVTSDQVDSFLGRAPAERFQVPQIVVIDRAGVIRAQSRGVGEADLTDEVSLRKLVERLLDESAPAEGKTEASPPAGKSG